jgi:hypothetical protein
MHRLHQKPHGTSTSIIVQAGLYRGTRMVVSKRRVQKAQGDAESRGRTELDYAEEARRKLYQHLRETDKLNNQWRVGDQSMRKTYEDHPMTNGQAYGRVFAIVHCHRNLVPVRERAPPVSVCFSQSSLTRVSLALTAVLGFKIYNEYERTKPSDLLAFCWTHHIELAGAVLGGLIADFIRKERPRRPITFWLALALSLLEVALFVPVAMSPQYVLSWSAVIPIGTFYFLFVVMSERIMERTRLDAKKGAAEGDRLLEVVDSTGGKVE